MRLLGVGPEEVVLVLDGLGVDALTLGRLGSHGGRLGGCHGGQKRRKRRTEPTLQLVLQQLALEREGKRGKRRLLE
jgi:hypothetical protein